MRDRILLSASYVKIGIRSCLSTVLLFTSSSRLIECTLAVQYEAASE